MTSLSNVFNNSIYNRYETRSLNKLRNLGFEDGTRTSDASTDLRVSEFYNKTIGYGEDWTRISHQRIRPPEKDLNIDELQFGFHVEMSKNGNVIVVSCNRNETKFSTPEQVAVYVYGRADDEWYIIQEIKPPSSALYYVSQGGGGFGGGSPEYSLRWGLGGYSGSKGIAISDDGEVLVISAPDESSPAPSGNFSYNESGAVYVYKKKPGMTLYEYDQFIKDTNPTGGHWFGACVAISGDKSTLLIGAGQTYAGIYCSIYTQSGGNAYSFEQKFSSVNVGKVLTISHDGNTFAAGNYTASPGGQVIVWQRNSGTTTWTSQTLTHSDTESNDQFGTALKISGDGNTLVIGAYGEDGDSINNGSQVGYYYGYTYHPDFGCGATYVFTRASSTSNFSQQAKLLFSERTDPVYSGRINYFGRSVSTTYNGDIVIVGAFGDTSTNFYYGGTAIMYKRTGSTWEEKGKIMLPDSEPGNKFGINVSISSDGGYAVVGASAKRNQDLTPGIYIAGSYTHTGAIYALTGYGDYGIGRDNGGYGGNNKPENTNTSWEDVEQYFFRPPDIKPGDYYGSASAISRNGDTVIVSSYYKDHPVTGSAMTGAAYIYKKRDNKVWTVSRNQSDIFDLTVPLQSVGGWSGPGQGLYTQYINSFYTDVLLYGWDVSISGQGDYAAVSFTRDNLPGTGTDVGGVCLWQWQSGGWVFRDQLRASDKHAGMKFGWSIALSGDGLSLIVGTPTKKYGTTFYGGAYIFKRYGNNFVGWTWFEEANLQSSDKLAGGGIGDDFGQSVAISHDGMTAVVGAPEADAPNALINVCGAAFVFIRTSTNAGNTYWQEQAKLVAHLPSNGARFGGSWKNGGVAISGDGNTIAVGSIGARTSSGADAGLVYIYVRNGTTWSQQAVLQSDTANTQGGTNALRFGDVVSLTEDGNTVMISATYFDNLDAGTQNSGAVYIFTRSGYTWTQRKELIGPAESAYDYYGVSSQISSNGEYGVVGAEGLDLAVTPGEYNSVSNAGGLNIVVPQGSQESLAGTLQVPPGNPFAPISTVAYPPQALPYSGYIESSSSYRTTTVNGVNTYWVVQNAFDYNTNRNNGWRSDTYSYSRSMFSAGNYIGSNSLGGIDGEWAKLNLPSQIRLYNITLWGWHESLGSMGTYYHHRYPKELTVLGSNDNTNWTSLKSFTGLTRPSYGTIENLMVQSTQYFSYYAIVVTKNNASGWGSDTDSSTVALGEIRFYGY